jgi:hypothetical protein
MAKAATVAYKGINGVTFAGGSSNPCPADCTQPSSSTLANEAKPAGFGYLNKDALSLLKPLDVNAAYGSKPTSYSQISGNPKYLEFMKTIANTRGYEQYKDAGGKNTEMETALAAMVAASGGKLTVNNTYRSYDSQVGTYFATTGVTSPITKYWGDSLTPEELAQVTAAYTARGVVSAPPGFSQHCTGLAVDFATVENSFEGSPGYAFLKASAESFGFKESYPKGTNKGAGFEPWHWQFVGNATYKLSTPLASFQIGGSSPCTAATNDTDPGIDVTAPDPTVTFDPIQ